MRAGLSDASYPRVMVSLGSGRLASKPDDIVPWSTNVRTSALETVLSIDQRAVKSGTRAISVTVISVTPRDGENGQPTPMSVESIFQQLHNPTTWPAPPERPLKPYSADLRPSPMPVETLRRSTPARNCTAGAKRRDRPCGS